MRERIEIEIPVREKGIDITKVVVIDMITNGMHKEYIEISKIINRVAILNIEMQEILYKMKGSDEEKDNTLLIKKLEEKKDEIVKISKTDFFERRFRLISMILLKNKCTDKDLLDPNYWDENIDMSTLISFIDKAMNKDNISDKKKALWE